MNASIEAVPFPVAEAVVYKRLTPEGVKYLCARLPEIGYTIPYPEATHIVVAELEGKLIGFIALQLMFHTEPLHVDLDYRGLGIAERLATEAVKLLNDIAVKAWVCVATDRTVERLCESMGMHPVEGKIYASKAVHQ
jgi:ribosomal protein S18 acetylase RimI-like enzyme